MVSPVVVLTLSTSQWVVGEAWQSKSYTIWYADVCSQKVMRSQFGLPNERIIDILSGASLEHKQNHRPAGQMGLYSWQSDADADVVLTEKTRW